MNIAIKTPAKCDKHELENFEALVRMGEEVTGDGLTERIRNAAFLMFLTDADGSLIGVSALKRPNSGYRAKIFKSARSELRRTILVWSWDGFMWSNQRAIKSILIHWWSSFSLTQKQNEFMLRRVNSIRL
jgi:hypothetical protein